MTEHRLPMPSKANLRRDRQLAVPSSMRDVLALYHAIAADLDSVMVLTSIRTDGRVLATQFEIGDVEGMAREAQSRAASSNVFFAPAVYRRGLPPGSRGSAADLVAVVGLVIDDDADTGHTSRLPELKPTFEVVTSSAPATNRQLHYALTTPAAPDEASALAAQLHDKCGGDHGTKDVAHVWRLPGTLNFPSVAKLKRGRPASPQSVGLVGGTMAAVDAAALHGCLADMPHIIKPKTRSSRRQVQAEPATRFKELFSRLPKALAEAIMMESVDDRSAHSFVTMKALFDLGLTDQDVAVLAEHGLFARKYVERGDLDQEIARVRTKSRNAVVPVPLRRELPGAQILEAVSDFLTRFVAYPSVEARVAHVLWLAHTYAMAAWDSTPRLAFVSPEPGSGKSRALEVSAMLVPRPVEAMSVTPSFLFRRIGDPRGLPTLLIDEMDAVFGPRAKGNEELRALINGGHRRNATVGRSVQKASGEFAPDEFPVYAAVAMAGLGSLPSTIRSRSIVISMRRRGVDETVEPFRRRDHQRRAEALAADLAAWMEEAFPGPPNAWPDLPASITDRDADVWECLIAISDAAEGPWPARARQAAVAMVAASKSDPDSQGVRLLASLRQVFGEAVALPTHRVLKLLQTMPEEEWGNLRGKPLDERGLAKRLRAFGVRSRDIRHEGQVVKGYLRADLSDAWRRYLPAEALQARHPRQENNSTPADGPETAGATKPEEDPP